MIRNLKIWAARALLVAVVAAGLGFGILAAALAAVIGGLLMLGVRLSAAAAAPAPAPAPGPEPQARPDAARPA